MSRQAGVLPLGAFFLTSLFLFFPCMWWSWFSLAGSSSVSDIL